jgi:CheY-like chemotaxis protein
VILLAYNTAPSAGLDIIRAFRRNAIFKKIPIVLLIEDLPNEHIRKYYEEGVNTIIKKPFKEKDTREKISIFFKYWFEVAEL